MGENTDCRNYITYVWTVSAQKREQCTNTAVAFSMEIHVYHSVTLHPSLGNASGELWTNNCKIQTNNTCRLSDRGAKGMCF